MLKKNKLPFVKDTILLTGETGVGKSSLAKWIHNKSIRADKNYLHLNIASLSEQLFESELFGHKKGSFTGATCDKVGFCEKVGKGTLFLDEIGDLSLELQKKILTLVDEKIYYPVGSTTPKVFEGELIVATHRSLRNLVDKKKFRKDLYYRLIGFHYEIKPLRSRQNKSQIIEKMIEDEREKTNNKSIMTEGVKQIIYNYSYPGNFRELKQLIKYVLFVSEGEINRSCMPSWLNSCNIEKVSEDNFYDALEIFEKNFLVDKLKKYQGKINQTANKINISKVTLISKIKKYDINITQLKMELLNGF